MAVAGSLLTTRGGLAHVDVAFGQASHLVWRLLSYGTWVVIAAALTTRRAPGRHGGDRQPPGRKPPSPVPVESLTRQFVEVESNA